MVELETQLPAVLETKKDRKTYESAFLS
jgi:hypothetical protein